MHHGREEIEVSRDCPAVSVPYGAPVTIEKGCTAQITQKLGGSYTVYVDGNLYRVEGVDADALGFEPTEAVDTPVIPEGPLSAESVRDMAWSLLATCFDPEIPVDIVNLGLVYRCEVETLGPDDYRIDVDMTLTAPGCGMGTMIADEARVKLLSIHGVSDVNVNLVWEPPWGREMMSEIARLEMGMM